MLTVKDNNTNCISSYTFRTITPLRIDETTLKNPTRMPTKRNSIQTRNTKIVTPINRCKPDAKKPNTTALMNYRRQRCAVGTPAFTIYRV